MSPRLSASDRDSAEVYEKDRREMLQESDAELLKVRATGNECKKELAHEELQHRAEVRNMQIRASRGDCLGAFVSFSPPPGQPHDESRFTRFRFDLDLTTVPVSHNALADCQAETISRTDALCGEERLKDVRKILR
jgi:hypothetical protein